MCEFPVLIGNEMTGLQIEKSSRLEDIRRAVPRTSFQIISRGSYQFSALLTLAVPRIKISDLGRAPCQKKRQKMLPTVRKCRTVRNFSAKVPTVLHLRTSDVPKCRTVRKFTAKVPLRIPPCYKQFHFGEISGIVLAERNYRLRADL